MSARLWVGLCAVLLAAAAARAATAAPTSRALFAVALEADDLARASLAQRLGDAAVLEALAQHEDTTLRLAAVRCAPYLREPQRALAILAELAAGRDPELAPAAARRLRGIAQQLALQTAAEDELDSAIARDLRALAATPSAASEVRVRVGEAAFLLDQQR